jgi:hypothetical protein
VSIEVRGLEQLYRKLGAAAAVKTLEPPMQRGVLRVQRFMQEYPPSPARSEYVRTGILGRRWMVKVSSSNAGVVGKVGSNVPYVPFVQSYLYQTRAHRATVWHTDLQAVRQQEPVILRDFQSAVDRALAS